MSKTYIHYGHKTFEPGFFETPSNRRYANKPRGGLWASAINACYGWKDWCKTESYRSCDGEDSFCFKLTNNANIFTINSVEDVNRMPLQKDSRNESIIRAIDFESMYQSGIDAIEYNLSNDGNLYFALYGWDCDCILVLNPKVVIPI